MNTHRKVYVLPILIVIAMSLTPVPVASAQEDTPPALQGLRPDAPPYAVHGPFAVGTLELMIEDEARPLPVTVWYPAASDAFETSYTYMLETPPVPIIGKALLEATPDSVDGPYPLVVFSHGATMFRYASLYLVEHLASYGFVVMAPDHTGDTVANTEDEGVFVRSHATRPVDITRVIDFAAADAGGALTDMIDIEHVAVIGHSSGAWTALVAGGAQRDFRALEAWCADNPDDLWVCGTLLGQEDLLAQLLGLDAVPEGLWPPSGDPRVDAIVPLAPGNATLFGPEGLAAVDVPALIMIGSQDRFLPYASFGPPTYDAISGRPKAFVTFEGADHFLFGNGCGASPWMIDWGLYFLCSDSVWDMDRAHDLINHFTTAFLLSTLKGDQDAAVALMPDAMNFPGITYETTGF